MTMSWRLLLVDDDALVLEITAALLALSGHEVVAVGSGSEALARASERAFDAVVLDVQMPGMNGLEVARKLRELPGGAELVVLGLSGRRHPSAIGEAGGSDFDGFLLKPCNEEHLDAALGKLLAGRKAAGDA
jgi:CheY-like chemotaxis protein